MIQGDVKEFRKLLNNETEKNLSLHYQDHCVDFVKPEVKKVLKEVGAFYDDDFSVSLLHVAVATKNIEFVKLLIEAGCNVNTRNQMMRTPLHSALSPLRVLNSTDEIRNCESLIKFLLDHGADVNCEDIFHRPPLYFAVQIHDPSIACMFIAKGADVNKCDHMGDTPLHMASFYGSTSVFKLLLDNGADIYKKNTNGDTIFARAASRFNDSGYDILKLLLERKGKCDKTSLYASEALQLTLNNCDLRTIKLLSDYGALVTEDSMNNISKLHRAAYNPHVDVIEYILDHGIDVNAIRSDTNLTPLHIATAFKRSEVCKLLLSRGANVNCVDDFGHTPSYLAIKCNNLCLTQGTIRRNNRCFDSKDNETIINIFIAHIVKLVFSNISVNEMDLEIIKQDYEMKCYYENLEIIKQDYEMKCYYENCIEELEKMKIRKVYEDVSLFDILMKKGMASGYVRNEDLIEALDSAENKLNNDFPIYYPLLKEDFYQEIKKQRLIKGAAIVLNEIFNFHDPFHLANLKILSYLRKDDIIRINESKRK